MIENEEKLALSVHEVAGILGISVPTAYELARRADFPAFHIGRRTLVDRTGLRRWIAKQSGSEWNLEATALERGSLA